MFLGNYLLLKSLFQLKMTVFEAKMSKIDLAAKLVLNGYKPVNPGACYLFISYKPGWVVVVIFYVLLHWLYKIYDKIVTPCFDSWAIWQSP